VNARFLSFQKRNVPGPAGSIFHPFSFILLCFTVPAWCQPGHGDEGTTLLGESSRTARRLAAANQLVEQKRWADAIDEYQNILTEGGDDLVRVAPHQFLAARRICDLRLAAMPAEARQIYSRRVDRQAENLLTQAANERKKLLLLVDQSFCSSATPKALDLLGDLAFERGEFAEAERWWQMLALPVSMEHARKARPHGAADGLARFELVHPDPHMDPAYPRAKAILARLFRGDILRAETELRAFAREHGSASGHLAGREGSYATILQAMLADARDLPPRPLPESWATFAGDAERNLVPRAQGRLARVPQLNGPQWTIRLETSEAVGAVEPGLGELEDKVVAPGKVLPYSQIARSLAYYPAIAGELVFVADARHVTAYHLRSGRVALRYDLLVNHKRERDSAGSIPPTGRDAHFSVTVTGDRIYARMGAGVLSGSSRRGEDSGESHSYLICLNLHTDLAGRLERWVVATDGSGRDGRCFTGAPIVHRGSVYVAESQYSAGQVRTCIGCYGADSGELRWRRPVCESPQTADGDGWARHPLLTVAGSNVVIVTHAGAIIALDLLTGRWVWAMRYRSTRGLGDGPVPAHDPSPCIAADDAIFVAPRDMDRILCLDAMTGALRFESSSLEVVHLLGVVGGRLIFTATAPWSCIRAIDVTTSAPVELWLQPPEKIEGLTSFGRGLLAGDKVYWPTSQGLHVLRQENGEPAGLDPRIRGNLAAAEGCLAAAGVDVLSMYLPERGTLGAPH
jgi:outer membrane protein assembly factor BamB